MPNASKVDFSVSEQITGQISVTGYPIMVLGITKRGRLTPYGVSNWTAFQREFGGELSDNIFPTLCKYILDLGVPLIVSRVTNFANSATTALKGGVLNIVSGANTLFKMQPKQVGADYNNLRVIISDASNGDPTYFNLSINHILDTYLNESYPNLKIDTNSKADTATFLKKIFLQSTLMDCTYVDLSGLTGQQRPTNATYTVTGGTDGGTVVTADYIGDSATGNGFHAFDNTYNSYALSTLNQSEPSIDIAGAAYCKKRFDCHYFAHLDNDNNSVDSLITARALITENHPFYSVYAGGVGIYDKDSKEIEVSELPSVLVQWSLSAKANGPWWSLGNPKRGTLQNITKIVNDFGGNAQYDKRNSLANNQINLVVTEDGNKQVSGNFTGQKDYNIQSFLGVQMCILYILRNVRPIIKKYLEEPADLISLGDLYTEVKPFFKDLASSEKRALQATNGWNWYGDQDAKTLDDLQINNKRDFLLGKYKIKIGITPINSLQEISVEVVVTDNASNIEVNVSTNA